MDDDIFVLMTKFMKRTGCFVYMSYEDIRKSESLLVIKVVDPVLEKVYQQEFYTDDEYAFMLREIDNLLYSIEKGGKS